MENRINTELSAEDMNVVLQAVTTIREKLSFLVRLTADEKKSLVMMDDGRAPFTGKSIDYATREEALNPNPAALRLQRRVGCPAFVMPCLGKPEVWKTC